MENDLPKVPVIDFSSYRANDAGEKQNVVKQVLEALQGFGQMALVNHGISEEDISSLYAESRKFFSLSRDEKQQYKFAPDGVVGYLGPGEELFDYGQKDMKETMQIGKEGRPEDPNQWPKEVPTFKASLLDMFTKFDDLHLQILSCIEDAFKVEKGMITSNCNEQHEILRLLHYPIVNSKEVMETDRGTKRCGEHTDYGTITLLLQDEVGGLQIKLKDGRWIDVEPIEGAIVVQVGDMLERWTNGILPAARHRVVSPSSYRGKREMLKPRYSVAFFCQPNREAIISALPNTYDDKNPRLYKPFIAQDYLDLRVRASI